MKFRLKHPNGKLFKGEITELLDLFWIKQEKSTLNPIEKLDLCIISLTFEEAYSQIKTFAKENGYFVSADGETCVSCEKMRPETEIVTGKGYCLNCQAEKEVMKLFKEVLL